MSTKQKEALTEDYPLAIGIYQKELDELHALAIDIQLPVFLAAAFLRCSSITAQIWLDTQRAALPPHIREQVPWALEILQKVVKAIGVKQASAWLMHTHDQLNDRRPIDIIALEPEKAAKKISAALAN